MKAAIFKYPNPQFEIIIAKIALDEVYERKVLEIVDDYR
jgi:hypothetical protein